MASIRRMFQKGVLGPSSGRLGRYAARVWLGNRKVWVKTKKEKK